MWSKSAPMKASATSQFQSSLVSALGLGLGFRLSSSYGQMNSKYRFCRVHRVRISVRNLGSGLPRVFPSITIGRDPCQNADFASVFNGGSASAQTLWIV